MGRTKPLRSNTPYFLMGKLAYLPIGINITIYFFASLLAPLNYFSYLTGVNPVQTKVRNK